MTSSKETFKFKMITQKLNGAMEVQVQRHLINKLAKLEDAIAISKSETINSSPTALWVTPCRKPEIKKNAPWLPFFGNSYISDRII